MATTRERRSVMRAPEPHGSTRKHLHAGFYRVKSRPRHPHESIRFCAFPNQQILAAEELAESDRFALGRESAAVHVNAALLHHASHVALALEQRVRTGAHGIQDVAGREL